MTSRPSSRRAVSALPCVSATPTTTSRPSARLARAVSSMVKVLPTPGEAPRKTLSCPRPSRACSARTRSSSASGSRRWEVTAGWPWLLEYTRARRPRSDHVESVQQNVDELDPHERRQESTRAVDQQIASENHLRWSWGIRHPTKRQRNQGDDDDRVEHHAAQDGRMG